MDFGISFRTFGTGNDANVFLTDTFLSPVVLNPSDYPNYSLRFNNASDDILFSGNSLNDNLPHYICLNFSNTGLSSFIDGNKCLENISVGNNTGNYGFTGIISLFSGFNDYSINDLIILNRIFEDSEISGIYNGNILDFYDNNSSIYDFSTIPIKNRGHLSNQIYNPFGLMYSGRYSDYFSYYYNSAQYVEMIESQTININDGISTFAWIANFDNIGISHIYNRIENDKSLILGLSGNKLYFSLNSGNSKIVSVSADDIPRSGWSFVGCSIDKNSVDMFLDSGILSSNTIYKDDFPFVIQSGYTFIGSGIIAYIDEIRIY